MSNSKIKEIFTVTCDNGEVMRLQYHKKTGELYVNDKKVVTEVALSTLQKFLAYGVSLAIMVQGLMSVLSYFN